MATEHATTLPAGMTPISPKDKTTYPPVGQVVVALLRNCGSGRTVETELVHVEEDDVTWRTADDMSEVGYDWDVEGWRFPAQPA
jgi:hypothetical protein